MVLGDPAKIGIRGQHRQLEADAELSQERIDRAYLDAAPAAVVAQIRGPDVVVAFGPQERERTETLDDRIASARPPKPLKQLLQDQPGGEDRLISSEAAPELRELGCDVRPITPQGERPDTGVDEETQERDRSFL